MHVIICVHYFCLRKGILIEHETVSLCRAIDREVHVKRDDATLCREGGKEAIPVGGGEGGEYIQNKRLHQRYVRGNLFDLLTTISSRQKYEPID